MNVRERFRQAEKAITEVYSKGKEDDDLLTLARLAGLDPKSDFENADLAGIDLKGEDLTMFSFCYSDMRGSDLRGSRIWWDAVFGADFEGALIEGVEWLGKPPPLLFGGAESWNHASKERKSFLIDECNPIDGKYRLSESTTEVFERALPFYRNVRLLALIDSNWTNKRLIAYYLFDGANLFRLNGTSPPLHEVNAKAPIQLSDSNVLEYLRFFCFVVRGEKGPFYIAETMEDPLMPQEIDATTKSAIEGALFPAELEGKNQDDHYLCNALVFFGDSLFLGNFAVQPTGMIEMLDDDPIVSDLPVHIEAPVS